MAGRKQHYIPQFIQRAFQAQKRGVKSQVLVFKRDQVPFLTSTEGVGAARDFYSGVSESDLKTLDDEITDFESDFVEPFIRDLRSQRIIDVNPEAAALAVTHLSIRTAHVRDTMSGYTSEMFRKLQEILRDKRELRNFLGLEMLSSDNTFRASIAETISNLNDGSLSEKQKYTFERFCVFLVRERFDKITADFNTNLANCFLEEFRNGLSSQMARGHTGMLSKTLAPEVRVESLREMAWKQISIADPSSRFILPDCVAIAATKVGNNFEPILYVSIDDIAVVVMPLSPTMLLVGSKEGHNFSDTAINEQLARCSQTFFISSRDTAEVRQLSKVIGESYTENMPNFFDDENSGEPQAVRNESAKLLKIKVPTGKAWTPAQNKIKALASVCLDASTRNRIQAIVVPINMKTEVQRLLKRAVMDGELQLFEYGDVHSMKVGTTWECRLVVPPLLVNALANNSDPKQSIGATVLIKHLFGRANHFDSWATQCPQIFDVVRKDLLEFNLANVAFETGSHYFGGLASMSPEHDFILELEEVPTFVSNALTELAAVRLRASDHRNVDALSLEALFCVRFVLTNVASAVGRLDAIGRALTRDGELGQMLHKFHLWDWGVLFSEDLRRYYAVRDRWDTEAPLRELGMHIERLLWTVGVFLTPTEEGYWVDLVDDVLLQRVKRVLDQPA